MYAGVQCRVVSPLSSRCVPPAPSQAFVLLPAVVKDVCLVGGYSGHRDIQIRLVYTADVHRFDEGVAAVRVFFVGEPAQRMRSRVTMENRDRSQAANSAVPLHRPALEFRLPLSHPQGGLFGKPWGKTRCQG